MTRVSNFGRKRTYLEASFGSTGQPEDVTALSPNGQDVGPDVSSQTSSHADGEPPKKKRKRVRKKRPAESMSSAEGDKNGRTTEGNKDSAVAEADATTNPTKKSLKKKKWKDMEKRRKEQRLLASEMRRQKRIQGRAADTICFVCREKGHAAKDCANVKCQSMNNGTDNQGKKFVGLCYRCGSTRHSLSKCKKPIDTSNPLPFASCFVCSGEGHLASACPQNQEKGIYPNGGCCKLCGQNTHLAKDCDLQRKDTIATLSSEGSADCPGADEDDFHTLKRRKQEVDKEDTKRKMLGLKTSAQSKLTTKYPKKVVYF